MSTATMTRDDIPETFEGRGGNLRFYGIADGRIKTRPDKNAQWEYSDKIHGIFDRVGEHQGEWNGKPMPKFEVDLLLKDGTKASIATSADSAVATVMLASRILKVRRGEVIGISTARSKEPTTHGNYLTFINVSLWDPMGSKWIEIKAEKFEGADSAAKLPLVLAAIRKHPDYAPRPTRAKEFDYENASQRECFDHEAQEKGWPALSSCQPEYLAIANALAKNLKLAAADTLDDVNEDVWQKLREGLAKAKEIPEALAKAVAGATDEYDPFANE